jgi:endonuclease/exonuclease/phosphatase family metal-dependent hydrolase
MKVIIFILTAFFLIPFIAIGNGNKNKKNQTASINLMTYNIRMNTQADGVNAWPLRKDKVIGLLTFYKPDLFGIQEGLPEQVADIATGLSDFENVGVGRDDGKSAGEHMSIFYRKSRFQKLDWGTFWLNEATDKPGFGWDAACNRTCTWIKLKDIESKKVFYCFNTHFDHRGSVARVEAAKLILKIMKEINSENLPCVLIGDFNSLKENEPIQLLLKELNDTRTICATKPYGPEGSSGGFEVKPSKRIIDYIFANDKVSVLRHGILTDSNGLYYHSDHLPVLAEIAFY